MAITCGVLATWSSDEGTRFPPSALDVKDGDTRERWYVVPETPYLLELSPGTSLTVWRDQFASDPPEFMTDLTDEIAKHYAGEVLTAQRLRWIANSLQQSFRTASRVEKP